jgi:hypothetical protein
MPERVERPPEPPATIESKQWPEGIRSASDRGVEATYDVEPTARDDAFELDRSGDVVYIELTE